MIYRITSSNREFEANGAQFEVEDDASEDDIAKAAAECVAEWISYGWEPVESAEASASPD